MALQDFRQKLILVTGAASGIGMETAQAFARHGARLLLVDINPEGLKSTQQHIAANGGTCHIFQADVADATSMEKLAREIHAHHGVLDVLVNNAGIAFLGSFLCTPLAQWQRTLDINIKGVVHGCHFFLPKMLEAGGPRHIVNVASAAGIAPTFNMSAYAASKHGVMGLSDSLALELTGKPVGVSVVCPGIINTPIANPSSSNVGANITPAQLQRLSEFYRTKGAHPSVVAHAIVQAIKTGRELVLVGPYASLMYNLRRISRRLLTKILIADSKKAGWI